MFDIHSHTYYSWCGKDDPRELINVAIKNGISLFGICDHNIGIGKRKNEYIEKMHKLGKKLWINAIVFDHKRVLAGGHTVVLAMIENPDDHWGWMADKKYDIIQTDWPAQLRYYLEKSGKYNKK